jgi:DNA primase small subunit
MLMDDTVTLFPLQGQLKRRRQFLLEEIIFQYAYPRLDINVTKGLNHLLKSPFCVHPKTGKVCIPFSPRAAEKFNPSTVPTIRWVN